MSRTKTSPWTVRHAILVWALAALSTLPPAGAQPAPIPHETVPFTLASDAASNPADQAAESLVGIVASPDAPWLRVHIREYRLGPGSCIVLTSLLDGATQRLDARSLPDWHRGSAFFNGDAVSVALRLAPGDADAFVAIDRITVGQWASGLPQQRFMCGADDRIASTDAAVGRLVPVGCTGWIVSNGAHLTAGHCAEVGLDTLEFNVPPSLCDGTIVHPSPDHQYPAITTTWNENGVGRDWAVFACAANSNTGLSPVRVQGAFHRMSVDHDSGPVGVRGYGIDNEPNGCNGGLNAQSQTLQVNSGPYLGEEIVAPANVRIEYLADTESGCSGAPAIEMTQFHALGIHTHGGCVPPSQGNFGTGFENNGLETAIQTFPGPVVIYADISHASDAARDGTIFRPFRRVSEAVLAVPDGGIVSIVQGGYTAAFGNVFTAGADGRAMTLQAPVGLVRIGN